MSKQDKLPNYNRRLLATGTTLLALGAAASFGLAEGAEAVSHRIHKEHTVVDQPDPNGIRRDVQLGNEYEVDSKPKFENNLSDISIDAKLPDIDSRATLKMLTEQVEKEGLSPTDLPSGLTLHLPENAQIGVKRTGE